MRKDWIENQPFSKYLIYKGKLFLVCFSLLQRNNKQELRINLQKNFTTKDWQIKLFCPLNFLLTVKNLTSNP